MIKGINQGSIHNKLASNPGVLFHNIPLSVNRILEDEDPAKYIQYYTNSEGQMIINKRGGGGWRGIKVLSSLIDIGLSKET